MQLNKQEYDEKLDLFCELGLTFQVVQTSTREYIKIRSDRYYLTHEGEERPDLSPNEFSLISHTPRMIKKRLEEAEPLTDCKGLPNYCFYNMSESFATFDICEVDIKAAYLSAAKKRKLLPQKQYDKFFELEENKAHEYRKSPNDCKGEKCKKCSDGKHLLPHQRSTYLCKDTGAVLKNSKITRLMSLGVLAQRKTITEYNAQDRTRSVPVRTWEEHNQKHANAFFRFALDIDIVMLEIAKKIEGVFFCWVDAIFCTNEAAPKVAQYLLKNEYESRTTQHDFMNFDHKTREANIMKYEDTIFSPYKFSRSKHVKVIEEIEDTSNLTKKAIEDYQNAIVWCDKAGFEIELNAVSRMVQIEPKELKEALKKTGYKRPLDYALFYEVKDILKIESLQDFNLFYLLEMLNNRGLDMADFMKVQKTTEKNVFYKNEDLEYCITASIFFDSFDKNRIEKEKEEAIKNIEKEQDYIEYKCFTIPELDKISNSLDRGGEAKRPKIWAKIAEKEAGNFFENKEEPYTLYFWSQYLKVKK